MAFESRLPFPGRGRHDTFREHRLVVLPEYQGIGIGSAVSECMAKHFHQRHCRYCSRTQHPRLGQYRERSPAWKSSSKNRRASKAMRDDRARSEAVHVKPEPGLAAAGASSASGPSAAAWGFPLQRRAES